ncbi:Protein required for attachment to host cells [Sphingomonas laterariae]|uniref:Protein required for attachment to host cells n=1 Tax=Edaphosphingomonas laterariae TaxID=861865 RepID=A0A239H6Y2_9SPHN|nr:host attachment family protein [Sphingomonas laterariae]SNS76992.1 Protein required for attachment to host cells [Sphingomonas laterariae]
MRVPHNSVVLVADGRKMLFLRNTGDADYPNLEVINAAEQPGRYDRDFKTDAPGRAFQSFGSARSAMEEVDFQRQEEDRFAADAAAMLKRHAMDGDYDSLIVVAPPRTLGALRKCYHREVTDRLKAELPKDLTGHPVNAIGRILIETE